VTFEASTRNPRRRLECWTALPRLRLSSKPQHGRDQEAQQEEQWSEGSDEEGEFSGSGEEEQRDDGPNEDPPTFPPHFLSPNLDEEKVLKAASPLHRLCPSLPKSGVSPMRPGTTVPPHTMQVPLASSTLDPFSVCKERGHCRRSVRPRHHHR
jgi:hypothetical protein